MSLPVDIQVNLEGVEGVTAGFSQIGESAANMGTKVAGSTIQMDVSYKRLALSMASIIANGVQLGNIMSQMASGQMDVGKGALMLAMNFLQLGGALLAVNKEYWAQIAVMAIVFSQRLAHIALLIAEKVAALAAAVAHGILASVMSLGTLIPVIAAAAIAGAIAVLAAQALIPSRQYGGPIERTGPYLLHAGEYVIPAGSKTSNITINIYGVNKEASEDLGDKIVDKLRRAGIL
jgi:hypothetical protein